MSQPSPDPQDSHESDRIEENLDEPYEPQYERWPSDRLCKALLGGFLAIAAVGSIEYIWLGLYWLQSVIAAAMALALFLMGLMMGRRQ